MRSKKRALLCPLVVVAALLCLAAPPASAPSALERPSSEAPAGPRTKQPQVNSERFEKTYDRVWRITADYLKAPARPSPPFVVRGLKKGIAAQVGWNEEGYRRVVVSPELYRGVFAKSIPKRKLYRHILVHEFAHIYQDGDLFYHPFICEASAEAFARFVSTRRLGLSHSLLNRRGHYTDLLPRARRRGRGWFTRKQFAPNLGAFSNAIFYPGFPRDDH